MVAKSGGILNRYSFLLIFCSMVAVATLSYFVCSHQIKRTNGNVSLIIVETSEFYRADSLEEVSDLINLFKKITNDLELAKEQLKEKVINDSHSVPQSIDIVQ